MTGITVMWIVLAVLLAVVEAASFGLISIWFCIGAVFAAAVSCFSDVLLLQFAVFIISSAVLLLATRPLVKKYLSSRHEPTNADRIIGRQARVIADINSAENRGQVQVDGQVWSARADEVIQTGETVTIDGIEGVKVLVHK